MTEEKKIIQLEKLLRNAPEIMTPIKVSRFSPLGKNRVYELIKTGELTSFIYQGIACANVGRYVVYVFRSAGLYGRIYAMDKASYCNVFNGFFTNYAFIPRAYDV